MPESAVRLAKQVRDGDTWAAFQLIRRLHEQTILAAVDAVFPVRSRVTVRAFDALADGLELARRELDDQHAHAVLQEHELSSGKR